MKTKRLHVMLGLVVLGLLATFTSCEQRESDTLSDLVHSEELLPATLNTETDFSIPKEEALEELISTLNLFSDGVSLRSGVSMDELARQLEQMDVNDILTVQHPDAGTTRSSEQNDVRGLMYLVNFGDDGGYAVLSADKRIPEPVLAIVESGSISEEDFVQVGVMMTEEERQKEIEGFKYYNEEEQDYYVGACKPRRPGYAERFVMAYAIERISDDCCGGGGSSPTYYDRKGEWKIYGEVGALLDTKWHQDSPFNDFCPERSKFILFGPRKIAPAGCVPLAIAQIMAYHEFPDVYSFNGVYVDWKEVKKVWSCYRYYRDQVGDYQNMMAAALLRGLGSGIGVLYGFSGSTGLPVKAKKYLALCGYKNVELHRGKNIPRIVTMLQGRKPVFMAGASGLGGHAWVIDGFRTKVREIEKVNAQTGEVVAKRAERETFLHCNWGWGGRADGYYVAGTFNTKQGPSELDYKDYKTDTTNEHYGWLFSIITYDR